MSRILHIVMQTGTMENADMKCVFLLTWPMKCFSKEAFCDGFLSKTKRKSEKVTHIVVSAEKSISAERESSGFEAARAKQ